MTAAANTPIAISQINPTSPKWNEIVREFADHTVFHSSEWLSIIQASHGVQPACAVAEQAGRCVAVWPLLVQRKGPFRVLGSPLPGWSTAYMGPLFAPGTDVNAILQAFISQSLFKRYAYFACRTLVHLHEVDLRPFGFEHVTDFETYWIDLSRSEDELWNELKSECRSRVRKAEKSNVTIRRESNGDFLADFWNMSLETFAKSHIQPTHTREFCEQAWHRLSPMNSIHVLSAWIDGRRAATLMLPFDSHAMYYWGGASYQEFRDVPVNNLLHWTAIRDAQSMGLKRYDLVSSRGGPGRFKKTFGPRAIVVARHWERSSSRLMRMLKNRYQAFLMKRRHVEAGDG